eukprot:scaffold57273_cov62-Attheya_sp.AAC.3
MDGLYVQMANVTKQDRALLEWQESGEAMALEASGAALFCTVTFCSGMWGYETMWTDLAVLRAEVNHNDLTRDYRGVGWPVVGKFKAEGGGTAVVGM